MGIIRGALVTIFTVLLFVSLFSTASFLTISMSLNYDIIKPEVKNIVNSLVLNQTDLPEQIDDSLEIMQVYCQNNTVFSQEIEETDFLNNYTFEIPCEVINQGSEAVINYTIDDLVEKNYYKEYDCEFRDCFAQAEGLPFFLFSKHSKNYWNGWFYTAFFISLGLAALLFFFMANKTNFPFLLGIVLMVVSLPFLGVGKLIGLIVGWEYAQIFSAFFTQSYTTFLIFIILGIISIGVGITLKFLSVGRFFAKLFKKNDKVTKKDLKAAIDEIKKPKKKKK